MKLSKFEKLNSIAQEVTKSFAEDDNYEIESRYMAAASSFAIDVKRIKIAETVISYHNKAKENNKYALIPKAILSIAKNENLMAEPANTIYECFFDKRNNNKFIREVIDAATVLKYEMRMYKKIENEEE